MKGHTIIKTVLVKLDFLNLDFQNKERLLGVARQKEKKSNRLSEVNALTWPQTSSQ